MTCTWKLVADNASSPATNVLDGVHIIYNNDGENLWSVTSSYHAKGAPITAEVIQGTVRDTIGNVDVNMICPFHNVPWWNSTLEPPTVHRDWYDSTFNFTWVPNGGSQLDFVLEGGDFVGTFVKESIAVQQKAFVTVRLNDGQMCAHKPTSNADPSLVLCTAMQAESIPLHIDCICVLPTSSDTFHFKSSFFGGWIFYLVLSALFLVERRFPMIINLIACRNSGGTIGQTPTTFLVCSPHHHKAFATAVGKMIQTQSVRAARARIWVVS
eukprot:m.342562 g.342562  ORF g.342562 m.342562 type:complete len:269 (+) comp20621_c0_seq37:58-864(+)